MKTQEDSRSSAAGADTAALESFALFWVLSQEKWLGPLYHPEGAFQAADPSPLTPAIQAAGTSSPAPAFRPVC